MKATGAGAARRVIDQGGMINLPDIIQMVNIIIDHVDDMVYHSSRTDVTLPHGQGAHASFSSLERRSQHRPSLAAVAEGRTVQLAPRQRGR